MTQPIEPMLSGDGAGSGLEPQLGGRGIGAAAFIRRAPVTTPRIRMAAYPESIQTVGEPTRPPIRRPRRRSRTTKFGRPPLY